ncbi:ATP-grasp domain-containing protein [Amycolatopsis sp. H6(2020)]|nr:ATP-grasp domain-containing protein [Amycolatopsis sp. H6(2020)]
MNEPQSVLLVIGSGLRTYREYLVASIHRCARRAGLGLVLLNNLKPTWQRRYFDDIVHVDVFDADEMLAAARAVAGRHHVVGLMCWDEPVVLAAGELAAELGVPGLSVAGVRGCRDKNRTRTVLTAEGLPQPGYALTTGLDEARAAAARIGYPVVLKPRAMGASIGVVSAGDESELDAAFAVAMGAATVDQSRYGGAAIVEGFVRGPEISIDAAVHKGEYLPMFVARKHTGDQPYFEEVGHVVDARDPLLHDAELLDVLVRAHRALGVEDGITHTEVRLTDHGPVIIEVNGRLGGDLIPFLGKTATGIDPGEVLFAVTTGTRPVITPARRAVAGIRFGYPEHDCLVHEITVPADREQVPGLVLAAPMTAPGTTLRLPPGGYLARHSFVVCEADDPETCAQRLDTAAASVRVDAVPVGPPEPGTAFEMPAGLLDVDEHEGVSA